MHKKGGDIMKILHIIAFLLVLVGALNWGLIGAFNFNLVSYLLAAWPMLEKAVYILVGLSAIVVAVSHKQDCKMCSSMMK